MCYQWKNSWPHTPLCLYTVWSVFNLYLSQNRVIYAIFRETELNGHCFKQKQKGEVKAEIVILYLCTFLSKEIENHPPPQKKKWKKWWKQKKIVHDIINPFWQSVFILAGALNLNSGVGVYACDPEGYEVFKELLDPVIMDYHKVDKVEHPPCDFGPQDKLGFDPLDATGEFIVSTRVRVGRSHEGYPFPPVSTDEVSTMVKALRRSIYLLIVNWDFLFTCCNKFLSLTLHIYIHICTNILWTENSYFHAHIARFYPTLLLSILHEI